MPKDNYDIFISYHWGKEQANQKKVKQIKEHLEKKYKYKIWMDVNTIAVGQKLCDEIETGMRSAKIIILALTSSYSLSPNCRKEIALEGGAKIGCASLESPSNPPRIIPQSSPNHFFIFL